MIGRQRAIEFAQRPGVLLIGNYRPTLAMARRLEPLGYRVVVAGHGGEGAAEYSRHVSHVIPMHELGPAGLPIDPGRLSQMGINIVIPVTEESSRQIAKYRESLSPAVVWATPSAETVLACLDKPTMFARCRAHGIPTEAFVRTIRRNLSDAIRAIGVPVVVRPNDSTRRIGGEKAVFIDSPAQVDCAPLKDLPDGEVLVVQSKASGIRHNLYFAAAQGTLVGICEARIERTDRPNGSGLAVEGATVEPNKDLVRWTETLTQCLAYTGIGCAQFLVDRETNSINFLEINPRVPGNHAIAESAGLPLAKLCIELAMNRQPPAPMIEGRPGLRFAWTYGDLRGLREAKRNGDITGGACMHWLCRTVFAATTAHLHMTFSWSDPVPTLVLFGRQFMSRKYARAGSEKILRGSLRT